VEPISALGDNLYWTFPEGEQFVAMAILNHQMVVATTNMMWRVDGESNKLVPLKMYWNPDE
jgi:hypothetical protein